MAVEELKLEISGIELSERFYYEVGKPMLTKYFRQYMDRAAAGLCGEGSECFGFDDIISTDHDYGPSFCLWLPDDVYKASGDVMNEVYNNLPGEFLGMHFNIRRDQAAGRRGVMPISGYYSRFMGTARLPEDNMEWARLPEEYLAAATNGKVFEDPEGTFTSMREHLLAYYPEDVRRKKIAARAVKMAHAGQVNFARMMSRHDEVAASFALDEFKREAVAMVYLLNKVYKPYYKWMWRGLSRLPKLTRVSTLLEEICCLPLAPSNWPGCDWKKNTTSINSSDPVVLKIEEICALIIEEMRAQNLSTSASDYLEVHGYACQAGITDSRLKSLSVLAL